MNANDWNLQISNAFEEITVLNNGKSYPSQELSQRKLFKVVYNFLKSKYHLHYLVLYKGNGYRFTLIQQVEKCKEKPAILS